LADVFTVLLRLHDSKSAQLGESGAQEHA
jgi:hypothetical protein